MDGAADGLAGARLPFAGRPLGCRRRLRSGTETEDGAGDLNDFYFGPETVKIKEGTAVNWIWSETNSSPHDVHLKSGPSGLKQKATYSTKTTAVTDASFKRTFTTPGTYHFICTIHPTQMHLTVVVRK